VLVPEGEELRIEIRGELAGILELCRQSKTPGRSRASAEQIKVVAGGRLGSCALFVAPGVIGLILGPLAEAQFRRALSISQGDWTVFFTDPLSLALLIIAVLALLGPFLWRWRGRRQISAA
jgi:hypothetical protein